jgi:hypothetical protein
MLLSADILKLVNGIVLMIPMLAKSGIENGFRARLLIFYFMLIIVSLEINDFK